MDLSVAIITKNEEKNIRRLLESLKPLNKKIELEIIIVDTGSTDNTVNIANEYTDKVYEYEWNNDFSAARNFSLDYCIGEWILVLDADEELKEYNILIDFLKNDENSEFDVCNIIQRSFTDSNCDDFLDGYVPRLIRNGVRYERKIHELPISMKKETKTDIVIYHYGYIKDDCNLMIKKYERNMKYLLEDKKNNINPIYTGYQIYNSYAMFGVTDKAVSTIKEQYNDGGENDYNVAIGYGLELLKANEYIKAIKVLELLKSKMGKKIINIDINYFLGSAYYQMKDYYKAKNEFELYLRNYNLNTAGIVYSINKKEEVKKILASCLYYLEEFTELINIYEQINDESEAENARYIYLYALLKCNKLKKYYSKRNIKDLDIEFIIKAIERYNYIEKNSYLELVNELIGINNKLDFILNTNYLNEYYDFNIEEIEFNIYYEWKGKLLRELVKEDYRILFKLKELSEETIDIYIKYLLSDNYCLINLYKLSTENVFEMNIEKLKVLIIVEKNILMYKNVDFDDYNNLIYRAGINSMHYTLSKYTKAYLESNIDNIDKYESMWFELSNLTRCNDKLEYIRKLKEIISENKEYLRVFKEFNLDDTTIISEDMIAEKKEILEEVENLVSLGQTKKALEVLKELLIIFRYDEEILMNIAVVYYIIGNIDEAMRYLLKAYFVNSDNADIRYNLGCVFEAKGYIDRSKLLLEQ